MQLLSPLPWQTNRKPTEEQLELESKGFLDFFHQQGGEL